MGIFRKLKKVLKSGSFGFPIFLIKVLSYFHFSLSWQTVNRNFPKSLYHPKWDQYFVRSYGHEVGINLNLSHSLMDLYIEGSCRMEISMQELSSNLPPLRTSLEHISCATELKFEYFVVTVTLLNLTWWKSVSLEWSNSTPKKAIILAVNCQSYQYFSNFSKTWPTSSYYVHLSCTPNQNFWF